jgi:hypothetical protein
MPISLQRENTVSRGRKSQQAFIWQNLRVLHFLGRRSRGIGDQKFVGRLDNRRVWLDFLF